jgi:hypothetical protein
VPDNRIIEFVTGGPKNYAYQIAKPDKDGNTTICKVRGITLNYKNVGSPGFFDELFFVLISHFHHLIADKIYTHHKNLVAGQHVEIFCRFGYVFYPRHVT